MIEMINPINKVTPDKNGYPFEKWLYYANKGGYHYCLYVGKTLIYGVEEDNYKHPDGLLPDIPNAIRYLEIAAEHNLDKACILLGFIYFGTFGDEYIDDYEAYKWFKQSAELGNQDAQYVCGYMYDYGRAGYVDKDLAYRWYVEAAYHDSSNAEMKLSNYYRDKVASFSEDELGDDNDDEFWYYAELSYMWGRMAAENGNAEGMYMTGIAYFQGFVVEQDREQAKHFLEMAAEHGNEDAQVFLQENF